MRLSKGKYAAIAIAIIGYLYMRFRLGGVFTITSALKAGSLAESGSKYVRLVIQGGSDAVSWLLRNRIVIYVALLIAVSVRMRTRDVKALVRSFRLDVSPVLQWLFLGILGITVLLLSVHFFKTTSAYINN